MSIKQISVFLENKPGKLKEMTGVLAAHNVDMRALSLAETKDFGIARLVVDDVFEATNILKEADFPMELVMNTSAEKLINYLKARKARFLQA